MSGRDPVLVWLARGLRGQRTPARAVLLTSARAWLARKPSTWTLDQYVDTPTTAYGTPADREWALAVAAWIRVELDRRRRGADGPNTAQPGA